MGITTGISSFIGEVLIGQPYPVFFDPHIALLNNKPPVTLITGSPGSGKTFFGLLLAAQASIANKMIFIIDPKGDFLSLEMLRRHGDIENVHTWTIFSGEDTDEIKNDNIGILDPLHLKGNIHQKTERTRDVIKTLVGNLTDKQNNYISPLIEDEIKSSGNRQASFINIADILYSNKDEEIRVIGTKLRNILGLPISKLISADKRIPRKDFNLKKGCFVASLMGLKLPDSEKTQDNMTSEERVSIVIMTLLTDMVMEAMKDIKNVPKLIIIDEAWSVMSTPQGRSLINSAALLGRSLNQAVILLTQSPAHILPKNPSDAKLDNTISTRFAFRNTNLDDNKITVENMGLPAEANWETFLTDLRSGSCLMNDIYGNSQFIHIMVPEEWHEPFNTNPLAKAKKSKKRNNP